jgi:pimeloyl-ACP methyl ester carboxylesterase
VPKAQVNGVEIEYSVSGDSAAPAFLLFMEAGEQLIMWPQALVTALVSAGYRVIRFDYRDTGLSAKFEEAGAVDLSTLVKNLQSGRRLPSGDDERHFLVGEVLEADHARRFAPVAG